MDDIISFGFDMSSCDEQTLLHKASTDDVVFELQLDACMLSKQQLVAHDSQSQTAMHVAATNMWDGEAVFALTAAFNAQDHHGFTVLHAIMAGQPSYFLSFPLARHHSTN